MLRSRGLLLTAQVWLTAILTLLSGVPRFSCVCPDGSVRSSFLGVVFSGGKVCCCAEPASGALRKSCCAAHSSAPSSPSRGSQCHKTVATSDALSAAAAPACGDVQAPALHTPPPAAESLAAQPASAPAASLPPPTDLIVRLQHLVI